MATPRVGALGVGTTKGDLYVVDNNGNLERIGVGTDGQILTADSTVVSTGLAWKNPGFASRATMWFDATLGVFKSVDLGGGAIANPVPAARGTHAVLGYNDTTVQGLPWQSAVPQIYDGGNLTLTIYWVALTAVVGNVVWAAAIERLNAGQSILTDGFAALQTAAASAAPGVLGNIASITIPFTNAQADAIAAGDPFRLFIQRTASAGGDTMIGDAQLVRAVLIED